MQNIEHLLNCIIVMNKKDAWKLDSSMSCFEVNWLQGEMLYSLLLPVKQQKQ